MSSSCSTRRLTKRKEVSDGNFVAYCSWLRWPRHVGGYRGDCQNANQRLSGKRLRATLRIRLEGKMSSSYLFWVFVSFTVLFVGIIAAAVIADKED